MTDTMTDPRIAAIRRVLRTRPAATVPRHDGLREAAVAIILRPGERLELLLIRRAPVPGDPWSGHVALPGGHRTTHDPDLLATARREAEEEVGVPLFRIGRAIGALDEYHPVTPLFPPTVIAPFVVAVPAGTAAQPDRREVQTAVWVPVDALGATSALGQTSVELPTGPARFPCLIYQDYVIWGLTYRIIRQFLEVVRG
jgi:8-oxo-dGTP pyrophosphatase MutT (NUDIX family)